MTARLLILSLALLITVGAPRLQAEEPLTDNVKPTITGKMREVARAAPVEEDSLPLPTEDAPMTEAEPEPEEEMAPAAEPEMAPSEPISSVIDPLTVEEAFQQPCCLIDDFNVAYPLWYVRTDLTYLNRTTNGALTTATVRNGDDSLGNNRITSMPFGYEPGIRVFAGRNVWDGLTFIEVGYFGLNNWNLSRGLTTESGLISSNIDMGFGVGAGSNVTTQTQDINYTSMLHNAELNIRSYFSPNVALIGGIRFTDLSEQLRINETGVVNLTTAGNIVRPFNYYATRYTQVQNSILGPQLGTDLFWEITDDIRIGGANRFLLGVNFSQGTVHQSRDAYNSTVNTRVQNSRAQYDEEAVIAGLMDLQATVDVRLTKNIVIKGGYQFMWLYQVAVAPNQGVNDIAVPNGPQRQIENGNSAIFFGPFAGLEISWGRFD